MSMSEREVVDAIRQLLAKPNPDREYVAKVSKEFEAHVAQANQYLARCHRWIQQGLFAEAVSLGEAIDLAKYAERLSLDGMSAQWGELCRAAKMATTVSIDYILLESYSDAWSRFHSLAALESKHRLLSLQRAPLMERLRVLGELVEQDPRNPEWLRAVTRLQHEAASELVKVCADAVRKNDDALALEVWPLVAACGAAVGEHREVLAQLQTLATAAKVRVAQRAARAACDQMHTAAAAMNLQALEVAAQSWQQAICDFKPDADLLQEAAASLQLLQAQQQRLEREKNQRDAVARLELALDQGKSFQDIEAFMKVIANVEATVPEALRMRVAAVTDSHRAAGRRRVARKSVLSLISIALLCAAGWIFMQWQHSLELVNSIVREVEAQLIAGAPDTAASTLSNWKLANPDFITAAQVIAMDAKVADSIAKQRAEIASAQLQIDQAAQLLQSPAYPAEFEKLAAQLRQLASRAPKVMVAKLLATADQLSTQAAASRSVALDLARAEFMRLQAALDALTPMTAAEQIDPASWTRRAGEYQSIVDAAKMAASVAVTNRDAQTIAESLQAMAIRASQLREQAEQNSKLYADAGALLKSLERIPASENAYRDIYVQLLPIAGDLLTKRKQLKAYEHGLTVAQGGVAVESWRQNMVPAILSGRVNVVGGLTEVDYGDASVARSIEPLMSKHLAEFPSSPHTGAAELIRGVCRRTLTKSGSAEGIGQAASAWLTQSGWANLGEQSLEDGRKIYRKRTNLLGDPWAQAIQNKNDLTTPADMLKSRAVLKGTLQGVSTLWPPSQILVSVAAQLPQASWRKARDLWLDMLAKEKAMQPSNPILSWHLQKELWNAWLEYFAEESDPVDAAAIKWVRSLDALRAVSASDPFIVASSDQAARSEDVRKVALQSLTTMPDIAELAKAAQKRDAVMDQGVLPAAIVGVMLAPQDGAYAARGVANGKEALIVGRTMNGTWKFFPVRIEGNEVLFVLDTPNPIPQSPQILFLRGAAK